MIDEPQIVQTEIRLTAVIRHTMARSDIRTVMGPSIGEVMTVLAAWAAHVQRSAFGKKSCSPPIL